VKIMGAILKNVGNRTFEEKLARGSLVHCKSMRCTCTRSRTDPETAYFWSEDAGSRWQTLHADSMTSELYLDMLPSRFLICQRFLDAHDLDRGMLVSVN
jgi:hypothetical protein